jgi:hypothetical protein
MNLRVNSPIDAYRLAVIETRDHHVVEWSGCLTISAQDNGETFIDISFDDQPVFHLTHENDGDSTDGCVSIECQAC